MLMAPTMPTTKSANDYAALMRMVQQNTVRLVASPPVGVSVDANQTTQLPFARLQCILTESIGASLFSWQFPKISLQAMYQYWHYGDATNKIPSTKYLQASDVDFLGSSKNQTL